VIYLYVWYKDLFGTHTIKALLLRKISLIVPLTTHTHTQALHELLPLAIEHAGRQAAVMSLFIGMGIMSANLLILEIWMGDMH